MWPRSPWDSPGKNTGVGCHFLLQYMKVKSESEVTQLCLTLSDPMDCSAPGSSVHEIFQAGVLEWGAIALSKNKTNEIYFVAITVYLCKSVFIPWFDYSAYNVIMLEHFHSGHFFKYSPTFPLRLQWYICWNTRSSPARQVFVLFFPPSASLCFDFVMRPSSSWSFLLQHLIC